MTTSTWNYIELSRQSDMFRVGYSSSKLIGAYSTWVKQHIEEGWRLFLPSFMFKQLSRWSRLVQMTDDIQRFYSTFITRVVRNPRSPFQRDFRPILIAIPDLPVIKRGQTQHLKDLSINDGLHIQGILLMPPSSRLKQASTRRSAG
jgi:hypothetical protein